MREMQLKRTVRTSLGGLWGEEPTEAEPGIRVARVADFTYDDLMLTHVPTLRRLTPSQARERILRSGDLLIEKSGGGERQNVGRVVQWVGNEEAAFSNFINVLRPAPGFDARWLVYLHRHLYLSGAAASCTKQSTGIQNLDLGAYLATQIRAPAEEDQCAIADFLDRECERIRRLLHLLEDSQTAGEAARRTIDDLFAGPTVRLGRVATVQTGLTLGGRQRDGELVERPYLRVANVQADAIVTDVVSTVRVPRLVAQRTTLRPGDVLMTEGGDIDKLGRGAVWDGRIEGCLHQNHVFAVRCGSRLRSDVLALWTRGSAARQYFESTASRITNIASTNLTKLLRLPVPDLSIEGQVARMAQFQAESKRLSAVDSELLNLRTGLAEYRDALITEAVTGKLDVTPLSDQQLDESAHAAMEGEQPEVLSA